MPRPEQHRPRAPGQPAPQSAPYAADNGADDDLKSIRGVGPVLERMLNAHGVHQFRQVATWSDADIDFFDAQLERFHGRIRRENWVRSAIDQHFKKYGEWLGDGAPAATQREARIE
jgi:predicted flap endonuclease-1-like 5' DNA nuclease